VNRSDRGANGFRGLCHVQAAEEPHFHDSCLARIDAFQLYERIVQRNDIRAPVRSNRYRFDKRHIATSVALGCVPAPGMVD